MVHLSPAEDLVKDTVYVVTVSPGVVGRDGLESAAEVQFQFRTEAAEEKQGCGCRVRRGKASIALLLLGLMVAARRRHSMA